MLQKIPKLDPPVRFRYLPGEVAESSRLTDFNTYKAHRLRVARAKHKIDNKAPKLDIGVYYKIDSLNRDLKVAKYNCLGNLDVVKKLNVVFRNGTVDCWNFIDKKYETDRKLMKHVNKKIERENKKLYERLNSLPVSLLSPQVMAKLWKVLKQNLIEKSRWYPAWLFEKSDSLALINKRRSRCFFDLKLEPDNLILGRIVFELYNDHVPLICANFEAFCKGFKGLSYKNTPFHRVLSNYYCQGGDVTNFNGTGNGASIHDETTKQILPPNTTRHHLHSLPGILSTISCNNDDNKTTSLDSKFYLTFRPLRTMDDNHVVFGKIVKGLDNLLKINAYGTKSGRPLRKVIVSNCGVLSSSSSTTAAV